MWGPPACCGDRHPVTEIRSIIATLAAAMTVSTSDRAGTVPSQERVCLPERHESGRQSELINAAATVSATLNRSSRPVASRARLAIPRRGTTNHR